jgi:PAS domain S-box-containing protein
MRSHYSIELAVLSYIVAVLASHVTLSLAQRLRPAGSMRASHRPLYWPWIIGGAFSMGTGIWSMHFIGMLAFHLPVAVAYDLPLTVTSWVIAVAVSGFALHRFYLNDTTVSGIALPGVFIGLGISTMHYTGMAAMQMYPAIDYDLLLFATSVLVAIGAAIAALWIAFSLPYGRSGKRWHKIAAASVMGAAIVGMHFTGMAAAHFAPNAVCISSGPRLDANWLAITIAMFTFLILGSTLLLSVIDAQLQSTIALSAEALRKVNEELEQRVLDRTAQLQLVNETLHDEVAARRESQQLLQAIIDNSQAVVYVKDLEGRYLLVNHRFEEIFNLGREGILGRTDHQLFARETADAFRDLDVRVGRADHAITEEETVPQADGLHTYISVKAPLRDEGGEVNAIFGISTDITERKQLYEALQRAYEDLRQTQQTAMKQERQRALGQMASGIAHDINNALTPAALYIQSLLDRDRSLGSDARNYLTITSRAIEDVANTIARMREFYRPFEPQIALLPVDLNKVIQQVMDLTRVSWNDMPQERGVLIRMQKEFAAPPPMIFGAENEIRDALTNLVLNAVDAMPEGGTLTIRSKSLDTSPTPATKPSATHVLVEVCDTGVGMTEAVRNRCLEPFFTTKGERGTGLGLAMVYGMTQRHGAELEIHSAPGAGTTMRLIFPVAEASSCAAIATDVRLLGRLRVLIADDDPLILQSLQDALERDGHLVGVADGGQAAIDKFRVAQQSGTPFDLVITDLGMPHVDGRTVAATLKSHAPAVPILMLTGWGYRLQAEQDVPQHVDRVLSKPPKLHELRVALAELAGGRVSDSGIPRAKWPPDRRQRTR